MEGEEMSADPYMQSPRGGSKSLLQHQGEHFKCKADPEVMAVFVFLSSLSTVAFCSKNKIMPRAQQAGGGMYIMYGNRKMRRNHEALN